MKPRTSVSLFLFIPERHTIVLGVRAPTQSFPHVLQATCHGTIEQGEDHADTLERELKEETTLNLPDVGLMTFLGELLCGQKREEKCNYYLAALSEANAKKIKPTREVGSFIFLARKDLTSILPLSEVEHKKRDPAEEHVMFDDELEALKMAFAVLDERQWKAATV